MNRLQYAIGTGEYIACKSTSANASTDWTDLNSSDFIDSKTGSALSADLAFAEVSIYNPGSSTAYLKLRARTGAGDSTANELFVLAGGAIDLQCAGLKDGAVVNIAYKKGASGDNLQFICAFNRKAV
jgi:hypothetical protein